MFTLPLLYVGGSVTTYRVGLAVPDWPTTFGINMFLYDFWNAPFGVRVEHTHRLYGAAVGMATLVLAGWFLVFERRRWMKGLGVLAVVAVIVQGVLGGTRVTQVSTLLAAVHGVHGPGVLRPDGRPVRLDRPGLAEQPLTRCRRRSLAPLRARSLLGLVSAQIVLGSWLRHYGTLAGTGRLTRSLAVAVWAHAVLFLLQGRAAPGELGRARPFGAGCWPLASTLQIVLGIVAMVYSVAV